MPATNGSRISRNSTTAAMTAASTAIQNIRVRVKVMEGLGGRAPVLIEPLVTGSYRIAAISTMLGGQPPFRRVARDRRPARLSDIPLPAPVFVEMEH